MSNETKQDVFDEVVAIYEAYLDDALEQAKDPHPDAGAKHGADKFQTRYSAALPDDMPVIPELIGEYLKMWKHDHGDLFQALDEGTSANLDGTKWESVQDWFSYVKDSFDTFASAWLAEMWIVEETGEIVKLEVDD